MNELSKVRHPSQYTPYWLFLCPKQENPVAHLLEGQLSALDILPETCPHCMTSVAPEQPYAYRHFSRAHAMVEPGVCKEMAWARRGYLHALWSVANFDSWYTQAMPGSQKHIKAIQWAADELDSFTNRCRNYFARKGTQWMASSTP